MGNTSVQQVRDLILDRLASGQYPLWSKLPTSRELAKELGAHRNTVAKAYQTLAEMGLVTLRQGRGTYVTDVLDENNRASLFEQIQTGAATLVQKARRLGASREELERILATEIDLCYATNSLRAAFVECNTDDTEAAVDEIHLLTGFWVKPLLLDTIVAETESVATEYDVLFTSLTHVKEVTTLLESADAYVTIIGVFTQPDEEALGQIAQIKPDSHVLVIGSNVVGARRFDSQIKTVASVRTTILIMPTDDEIRQCAAKSDVVICSRSRAGQVQALNLPLPVIVLPFHISQPSAGKIVEALTEPREVVAG
jgi:DNA-binding transcriptional regulator YhcF (GntR family)